MVTLYRPHYLRENRWGSVPACHLFVDVETTLESQENGTTEHKLKMGWACYWRRRTDKKRDTENYTFFTTLDHFWSLVEKLHVPRKPLYLIIHNVGYDFGILRGFDELAKRGWITKSVYTAGQTTILSFTKGQVKLKVVDNGNFFPGKLANLGEAVGFPKLTIDFDTCTWDELKVYCHRDVEIMVEAWKAYYTFIEEHELGNWGHTVPSQAFNGFRHRFMKHKILMHGNGDVFELERNAYKGGRCSVFRRGKQSGSQFYKLDVNSMYPSVMIDNFCPTHLVGIKRNVEIPTLKKYLEKYAVVAQVVVDVKEPVFPTKYKGRNVYPVGRFQTYLTTPEIQYALERDELKQVIVCVLYKQAQIFQEFVKYMYNLKVQYKREDNRPFYHIVKLIMNSLYGKFGMKAHEWTKQPYNDPNLAKVSAVINGQTGEVTRIYHWGNDLWTCTTKGEPENSFPAIAAHVTAYARLLLWGLIRQAGRENVFYCDTDSMIVNAQGYENLSDQLDPFTLGKLKIEEESTEINILAPKYYSMGSHWKRKGVTENAIETKANTFVCTQFPSLLSQGHWSKDVTFHTQSVTKTFSLQINDGTVRTDGWVAPLDAELMTLQLPLDEETEYRITELEWTLAALRESRIVPHSAVFRVWNYRTGTWKRVRNRTGNLVSIDYAGIGRFYQELGFDSLNEFQNGVLSQLKQDQRIRQIQTELSYL